MKTKCILEFNNMPQNAGTNDTTYSIHTMNFRVQLTKRDKVVIEKKLAVLSKNYGVRYFSKKEAKGYQRVTYLVAQAFGLNYVSIVTRNSKDGFCKLWMDVKVNPRWMFHENNHPFTYIASPDEVLNAYERIQEFLDAAKIEIGRAHF